MPDRLSWSNFLIKFLDQISWSKLLIEFLDHICWSTFLIMISFCTDLFSWSNFLLHLSDHALVGLVRNSIELGRIACSIWSLFWPDLIIWSDLIGPVWSKYVAAFVISIKLLVRIACSNFLIKFLDPSFRSRFGRLGSKFYRTSSNCLSELISQLCWPGHSIWTDLIGCHQILLIDPFFWSHIWFKFDNFVLNGDVNFNFTMYWLWCMES